jgi:TPR repeat protein
VFLDACRDNPFGGTRSSTAPVVGRGLAAIQSDPGTLIAFATQPDNTASDGSGRNSPFTEALLKRIVRPGTDMADVLRRVTRDVVSATKGEQVPWNHSSLTESLVLSRALELRRAPIHACDRAAAHPEDNARVAAGVMDGDLKISEAVAACRQALARHPGVPRFQYQLARALAAEKKDAEAFPLFLSAAEQGYTQANMEVVRSYFFGLGVKADLNEGRKWIGKDDDARTMYFAGLLLQKLGQEHAIAEGIKSGMGLIQRAAELDHVTAMVYLGSQYEFGIHVEQSHAKAAEWYRRAAERGDALAMGRLGGLYIRGLGVPKDPQQALHLFHGAAKSGDAMAMAALAIAYQDGIGVEKDAAKTAYWFEESAKRGNGAAMYALSSILRHGKGVPSDNARALYWLQKSAAANDAEGVYSLAKAHYLGELGLKADPAAGIVLFTKGAEKGHPASMFVIGLAHKEGRGVARDPALAMGWYQKSAERGYVSAMVGLAVGYETGAGVRKDYQESAKWFRRAADQGQAFAQFKLASFYERGLGVAKDSRKAAELFLLGVEREAAYEAYLRRDGMADGFQLQDMVKEARGWSAAFVTELKRLLQGRGRYIGKADGIFGDDLVQALEGLARKRDRGVNRR